MTEKVKHFLQDRGYFSDANPFRENLFTGYSENSPFTVLHDLPLALLYDGKLEGLQLVNPSLTGLYMDSSALENFAAEGINWFWLPPDSEEPGNMNKGTGALFHIRWLTNQEAIRAFTEKNWGALESLEVIKKLKSESNVVRLRVSNQHLKALSRLETSNREILSTIWESLQMKRSQNHFVCIPWVTDAQELWKQWYGLDSRDILKISPVAKIASINLVFSSVVHRGPGGHDWIDYLHNGDPAPTIDSIYPRLRSNRIHEQFHGQVDTIIQHILGFEPGKDPFAEMWAEGNTLLLTGSSNHKLENRLPLEEFFDLSNQTTDPEKLHNLLYCAGPACYASIIKCMNRKYNRPVQLAIIDFIYAAYQSCLHVAAQEGITVSTTPIPFVEGSEKAARFKKLVNGIVSILGITEDELATEYKDFCL